MTDTLFHLESFLLESTGTIVGNPISLLQTFKQIQQRQEILNQLKQINIKLDELWIVKAKAGINHLIDGINCHDDDHKMFELQSARKNFNELISLNPNHENSKNLIVVGYWGNYHYFNLLRNYKNSLLQAYRCTLEYPDISIMTFPDEVFDNFRGNSSNLFKEWIYQLNDAHQEMITSKKELSNANNNLAIATGIGAGIIVAGFVAPWLIPMGLITGLNIASEVAKASPKLAKEYQKYQQDTIKPLKKIVFQNQQAYNKYSKLIKEECQRRIDLIDSLYQPIPF